MSQTSSAPVPDTHADLLTEPGIAHMATRRPDGNLQNNPVWFEWDGEHVKVSQTRSRKKMRNLAHDDHVALSITDPANPYRYLELRGTVERIEDDPNNEFIDRQAQRYLGEPAYPWHQPGDERVVLYIRPSASSAM